MYIASVESVVVDPRNHAITMRVDSCVNRFSCVLSKFPVGMYVSYVLQMARLMGYLAFSSSNAVLCAIKTDGLILTLLTYSLQSIIFTLNVALAAPMIKSSALQRLVFKITTHGVCNFKMIKMQMLYM